MHRLNTTLPGHRLTVYDFPLIIYTQHWSMDECQTKRYSIMVLPLCLIKGLKTLLDIRQNSALRTLIHNLYWPINDCVRLRNLCSFIHKYSIDHGNSQEIPMTKRCGIFIVLTSDHMISHDWMGTAVTYSQQCRTSTRITYKRVMICIRCNHNHRTWNSEIICLSFKYQATKLTSQFCD